MNSKGCLNMFDSRHLSLPLEQFDFAHDIARNGHEDCLSLQLLVIALPLEDLRPCRRVLPFALGR